MTCCTPLGEGLTEQWPNEQWLNVGCTQECLLDPAAVGACVQVPTCPRKSSRDSVAAAFQGLWKITTHICHQASLLRTLFQHQRMWLFSRVSGTRWLQQSLPNDLPAVEPLFPMWPENLLASTLFLEIHPFHQSTASYGTAELQTLRFPCLQS